MRRLLAGLTSIALLSAGALVVTGNSDPIPARAAVAKEHRFSVFCEPVHRSAEDPFLDPIGTDQDHEHVFFGSLGIITWPNDPVDKEAGMRFAGTSCELLGDTASYWVPLFQDRNGNVIEPNQVLVYYRHEGTGPVVAHPPGTLLKSFDIEWGCLDSDSFNAPVNCPDRDLRMRVIFKPIDVDGTPSPRIAMNVRYDTRQGKGGEMLGGLAGEHGNFFNTWDQDTYQEKIDTCLVASSVAELTEAEWNALCPRTSGGEAP